MEFKEFIVVAVDGFTQDNLGQEFENCQILDFIKAKNLDEAFLKYSQKTYGNYEKISIYEIKR